MNNEFSTLLADVKEQILYLRELGAENLAVDLPEIDDSKFKIQNRKFHSKDLNALFRMTRF